jgi:putative queuosine salvage protein
VRVPGRAAGTPDFGKLQGVSTQGLFDEIRSSCREVTRRARFVSIEDEALSSFAARLARVSWPEEDLDPAHHFQGSDADVLAFMIALDAINFGSGWFPLLRKPAGLSGYRTIATACKDRFEAEGGVRGEMLRAATPGTMAELLGQELTDPGVAQLMGLFARAWRDLGSWLLDRYDDRFDEVVRDAGHCAERLVSILAEMPLYRDVAQYEELKVPFYKRAQITAADLNRAFGNEGYGRFDDLDQLTLFADNLVPHVLRCEGVLVYEASLARSIDSESLIEAGTASETEIRAVAVEAVERLVAELGRLGRPTTAHALDGMLWNAGQSPEIKSRPRHRARSTFY